MTSLLPEVRVLIERAAAHRYSLDNLVAVVTADLWPRRSPGDSWSAIQHLAHVAAADRMLAEMLATLLATPNRDAWLGGTADGADFARLRAAPVDAALGIAAAELAAAMRHARVEVVRLITRVDPAALDFGVLVPGSEDAWGRVPRWPLREYLAAWANHDPDHEAAIRRAITAAPDLSTVALARRRR